jgi:hypothetical protein
MSAVGAAQAPAAATHESTHAPVWRIQGPIARLGSAHNVAAPPALVQDGNLVKDVVGGGSAARRGQEDADVMARVCAVRRVASLRASISAS